MTIATALAPVLPLVPSGEEKLMRETVHAIAKEFGPDYYLKVAQEKRPPSELWDALGDHGFLGVNLPSEYGGGGLGVYELAAVVEEVSAAGCPLPLLGVSPGIIGAILARHGSEEQRDRWLTRIARGEARFAFAITEPDAGSNSHRIATTAKPVAGGYSISGQKYYISGVPDSEGILVVCKMAGTGENGRGRLSLFLVDSDAEGLEVETIPTQLQDPETQSMLFFDGVEVGPERLIGAEGEGLKVVFDGLNPERIVFASLGAGIARYALEKACAYANERAVWSAPIGAHQAIAHPLARAKIALEQARMMIAAAAKLYDGGANAGEAANIAKFAAAEAARECLDRAIQTHGGNGIADEYQLAQYWCMVRMLRIGPVSEEMILNFVSEHTLGLPRSY